MVLQKLYVSMIATPVSAEDAVAGEISWGAFRGLVSGTLMLVIAMLMHVSPVSIISILLLILLMVFIGILFGSLAMIVTSFAPNFDFFNYYTELIITPMLFFSGVFFPLDRFPDWVKLMAKFLPLTHAVNISRAMFSGEIFSDPSSLTGDFIYLIVMEIAAFYIGIKLMKRRLIK